MGNLVGTWERTWDFHLMDFSWIVRTFNYFWQRVNTDITDMDYSLWNHLPDVAIIEVFKYLNDKDKANAALTCKNWARLFQTPCLWRHRHLDMGGYKASSNGLRAYQFAEKFGNYVRYLSISCSHPSYHTTKIFQKAMEDLLFKLRQSSLIEFELERLELDRFWKYEASRDRLISSLAKFFKGQRCLQIFDMTSAQFPVPGGCRVIEAVGNQSGAKVEYLYIEDFFHSRLAVFQVKRFRTAISRFSNLHYIALNYNCISEEILEIFTKTLKGKLESMNLKVYKNDPHFHRISGYTWKMLHNACPKLTVTVSFESIANSTVTMPILVKEMPVKELHLWTGYDDDSDWRLSDTISHITDMYAGTLGEYGCYVQQNQEQKNTMACH